MGIVRVFLRQAQMFAGAVVLLVLFIVLAALLDEAGYKILGSLVAAVGVGLFVLSLIAMVLEPFVKAFRSGD